VPVELVPGDWVALEGAPEWGVGQVQSVLGTRVTVTFEHAGKRLVDASIATLVKADAPRFKKPG
jgi:hypothetical protein